MIYEEDFNLKDAAILFCFSLAYLIACVIDLLFEGLKYCLKPFNKPNQHESRI